MQKEKVNGKVYIYIYIYRERERERERERDIEMYCKKDMVIRWKEGERERRRVGWI
jgi:hypothetical protein